MNIVIVDANVIAKTFANEPDSQISVEFLKKCVSNKTKIVAPDLFKYEIAQIALRKNYPLEKVMNLFEDHISSLVELHSPNGIVWLQAEKICQTGHIKSGFPSMYDSIYHAMAIMENGIFVTADRRHFVKAKSFGNIALLDDWKSIFKS